MGMKHEANTKRRCHYWMSIKIIKVITLKILKLTIFYVRNIFSGVLFVKNEIKNKCAK